VITTPKAIPLQITFIGYLTSLLKILKKFSLTLAGFKNLIGFFQKKFIFTFLPSNHHTIKPSNHHLQFPDIEK